MKVIQGLKIMKKKNCEKNASLGHCSQQKSSFTTHQQPLKSLLYRNKSLKLLFGTISQIRQHRDIQKRASNQFKAKNELMTTRITKLNDQKGNQCKRVSAAKDQYLLIYQKPSKNELRQKDYLKYKKEEFEKLKATPKKCRRYENSEQDKRFTSTSYDPQSYNWRKDIQKQKQDCNNLKEYTTKSTVLYQKRHCRSRSMSAKPRIVKNVFQIGFPKTKLYPFSPKKSLQFTFGI